MKKFLFASSAVAGLALAACSSSSNPCTTFETASTSFESLTTPCAGVFADSGVTLSATTINTTQCQNSYNSCPTADQTTLTTVANSYNTCISAQTACPPASALKWLLDAGTCAAPIIALEEATATMSAGGISQNCAAGLSDAGF